MLPGFRFLFAATFLTLSILVFGLGAAALLRAAHEQFATNPSWHAAPEATFAQQVEPARPQLAMLRVGPPAAEQKASGDTPGATAPAVAAPAEPTPAERAATVQPPAEATESAALKPEPTQPVEAKSDMPAPENPAATASADAPASVAPQQVATSAPGDNAQFAPTDRAVPEPASPPNEAVPAAADVNTAASPATAAASPEADTAAAKTAALDNPSTTFETKLLEKAASAKPDPSEVKKQLRARRAAHRRRMAARVARLARLAAELQQQQAADPFGLRFSQPAAAAAVRSREALEPVPCPNPKTGARFCAIRPNQAGPVATGGPSGRPHSDHDPS